MNKLKYLFILIALEILTSCSGGGSENSCIRDGTCYGEWLAFRADAEGAGASNVLLDWKVAPDLIAEKNLSIVKSMDPRRFMIDRDVKSVKGYVANIGSEIKYITINGDEKWIAKNLGTGEIVDIIDLDGDGRTEIIFSAVQRLNLNTNSASGTGVLWVLDSLTGDILWKYNFDGIKFGLNRYRVSVVSVPGSTAKAILVPQTYDYSLMRFDFDAGVSNGYVKWRSDNFSYDSPDKPPIMYIKEGNSRIVVDSMGVLYLLDFVTGKIINSINYCGDVSFGGGLNYFEDSNGVSYAVVTSSSEYGKSIAKVKLGIDEMTLDWMDCREKGLGSSEISFRPFSELISIGSNYYVVATEGNFQESNTLQKLRLRAASTGTVHAEVLVGGELRDILFDTYGAKIFVIVGDAGTEFWKIDEYLKLTKVGQVSGFKWMRPFLARPGAVISSNYGYGVAINSDSRRALFIDFRGGQLTSQNIPSDVTNVLSGDGGGIYVSNGNKVVLVQPNAVLKPVLEYDPVIFSVPLIADIDGDGVNKIIVSYGAGKAKLRYSNGSFQVESTWPKIITEEKESLYAPAIGVTRADWSRDLMGFFREAGDLFLGSFSNKGELRWRWPVPAGVWESTFINAPLGPSSKQNITFYRNSRFTTALDQKTGALLWSKNYLGECQRQISAFDWNSDGIVDIGFQAGARTLILDGKDGSALFDNVVAGSYGAYVSTMTRGLQDANQFIFHNSGGFSVVDSKKGLVIDEQIYLRKTESLPSVTGKYGAFSRTYIVNGDGELRYFDGGEQFLGANLRKNVIAMTGAFVDGDDYTDLLVSTYDGELIAISGKTMNPIWKKQFSAIPGPAVAGSINGKSVILLVTSDGILKMLSN